MLFLSKQNINKHKLFFKIICKRTIWQWGEPLNVSYSADHGLDAEAHVNHYLYASMYAAMSTHAPIKQNTQETTLGMIQAVVFCSKSKQSKNSLRLFHHH